MTTCILKLREVRSPYHNTARGFRLLMAAPNMAGSAFGRTIPSFDKPYKIDEFGDFETPEAFIKRWETIKKELLARGYTKWSFVD